MTEPADLTVAVAAVEWGADGLAGRVHKAGVGGIAPLAARGRIACIGSVGGSNTGRTMGLYTLSQHALEA